MCITWCIYWIRSIMQMRKSFLILLLSLLLFSCSNKKYKYYVVKDKYEYVVYVKQPDVTYTYCLKKNIVMLKDTLGRTMSIQVSNGEFDHYIINDTIKIEDKNENK